MGKSLINNEIVNDFNKNVIYNKSFVTIDELSTLFENVINDYKIDKFDYDAYDSGMHKALHLMFNENLIDKLIKKYIEVNKYIMIYNLQYIVEPEFLLQFELDNLFKKNKISNLVDIILIGYAENVDVNNFNIRSQEIINNISDKFIGKNGNKIRNILNKLTLKQIVNLV